MSALKKRIVAIDYGTKRIGLAKSDPLQLFAQSVGAFSEAQLYEKLAAIEREDGIEKILLGNPTNGDGSPNRMTKIVAEFESRLQAKFPNLAIEKVSEFGTSKAAMQTLLANGTRRKERHAKGRLDKVAAAIMLQRYLETRPRSQTA
ncbi:MAG: Holliday junction resolvase RuvX [Chloroherpetonaceae bacterium]|nr:Holliday junction resolvase RuvX [Chloroherpetonaceae bacterium]